jgi:hypothetical protein
MFISVYSGSSSAFSLMGLSRLSMGAEDSWVGVDGDSGDIDGGAGMGDIIWSVDILCFGLRVLAG